MTPALGIVFFLGVLVNGCCYMALNDPATQPKPEVMRTACVNAAAFSVLASALRPARLR